MKKIIKWLFIAAAALVGLLLLLIVAVPFLVDPNDYKGTITDLVQKQTGRELTIPGDINLRVSRSLDVVFALGEVGLSSGENFPETPFVNSQHAEIQLALWPLLRQKQLQVKQLVLDGVHVNLIRSTSGQSNWEDFAGSGSKQTGPAAPADRDAPAQISFDIGGIAATDINVAYDDQQTGQRMSLNDFSLNTGRIRDNQSFPFATAFSVEVTQTTAQPVTAHVSSKAAITLSLKEQRYTLDDFSLQLSLTGKDLPQPVDLNVSMNAAINLPEEQAKLSNLTVRQDGVEINGHLLLKGFAEPNVEGSFTVPKFSLRSELTERKIALPAFVREDVLTHLAGTVDFSLSKQLAVLNNLHLELDETVLEGTLSATDLEHPSWKVDLTVDRFDADRYKLVPQKDKASVPTSDENKAATADILLPVDLLRHLAFDANIRINQLTAAKLKMTDVHLLANGKDGLIRLDPLTMQLYEGTVTVTGDIDARRDVPTLRFQKKIKGVQLGPLFIDRVGREEISGALQLQANVTTQGLRKTELTRNANGRMKLALDDGEIAKLKIIQTIRTAKALLEGKAPSVVANEQPTGFARLTASGILTNGVLENNDLLAESDLLKIEGKGTVDLTSEEIDYLLTVYLTDRIERQEQSGLVALGERPIPYRIKGTFTKIEQSAALGELLTTEVKKTILNELQKQLQGDTATEGKEKPTTDPGALLQKGLKGLFGN